MKNLKLITTLVLAFAFLFAQVGNVAAAPLAQDPTTSVSGTVQNIVVEEDPATGEVTVLVTLLDDQGATQTVRISEATAIALGLLQLDPVTNEPLLDPVTDLPVPVVLDPTTPLPVSIPTGDIIADEEDVHPITAILAQFFGEDKASLIDEYHSDGFGFGVIAQALWMEKNLDGEFSFDAILDAKESGDFSDFFPEGTEDVPTSWGQFKKALRDNDVLQKHNNLGNVVSGHAEEDENSSQSLNGKGNGKDKGQGKGKGKGHNKP